jgi:formylglycine-generating enzyme required for sulfatase activity
VGRHEVTYAEYTAFLDTLSPVERQKRLPAADRLHLLKESSGYVLEMSPSSIQYRVHTGEPLVYADRDRRASQIWERTPVAGISVGDAQAYAAWLADSHGLAGARICTDREWERAARGADDRVYPHGYVLEPDDADYDQTYGQKPGGFGPDEVGDHPASDSPWGVADMTGNMWEYVRGDRNSPTYFQRGGCFYNDPISQRSTNRAPTEIEMRDRFTGIRICADAN